MSLLVRNLMLMGLFYFNLFYLTPIFLKRHGVASFLFFLISLVLVVSFFNSGFHEYFVEGRGFGMRPPPVPDGVPPFDREGGRPPMMFASPTFSSLLITILVVGLSSLLVLLDDWT